MSTVMGTEHDDVAELKAMARRIRANARAVVTLPAGSQVGAELADLIAQIQRLGDARTEHRQARAALQARRARAVRDNEAARAAALRHGEEPSGLEDLPAIDAEIMEVDARLVAIDRGEEAARRELRQLVARNRIRYDAELEAARRKAREAVVDAIDGVEALWGDLVRIEASRRWIAADGAGTPHMADPAIATPSDQSSVWSVLQTMRLALTKEPPTPRPTRDADGTNRTGWNAYGKLAAGERRIGDPNLRSATDAGQGAGVAPQGAAGPATPPAPARSAPRATTGATTR